MNVCEVGYDFIIFTWLSSCPSITTWKDHSSHWILSLLSRIRRWQIYIFFKTLNSVPLFYMFKHMLILCQSWLLCFLVSFEIVNCVTLQLCSSFSWLFWVFWLPCISTWILISACQFLQKDSYGFDKDCVSYF